MVFTRHAHVVDESAIQANARTTTTGEHAGCRRRTASAQAGVAQALRERSLLQHLQCLTQHLFQRPKLAAALELLADTDGLVLDLRQNGGGDDGSADLLVRTLLDAKIDAVQQLDQRGRRTLVPLPPASLPTYLKPLVVLIDRRTASAAEFVAYSLQALGRARIVGTRSGGAAHMIDDPVLLPDGYQISIPDRQPINLHTGTNWERTGVTPDAAGGDDPLFVARQLLARSASRE